MDRNRHSRQEIRYAINRLKQRHPSAIILIGNLAYISNSSFENENKSHDDLVYDTADNKSDRYVVQDQNNPLKQEEKRQSDYSFLHRRSFKFDYDKNIKAIERALRTKQIPKFTGIRLDTCYNKS